MNQIDKKKISIKEKKKTYIKRETCIKGEDGTKADLEN